MSLGLALSGRDAMSDFRLQCAEKRKWKAYARNWSPNTRRLYSSRILSAMLVLDSKHELGEWSVRPVLKKVKRPRQLKRNQISLIVGDSSAFPTAARRCGATTYVADRWWKACYP
jgi:hypothetical protein